MPARAHEPRLAVAVGVIVSQADEAGLLEAAERDHIAEAAQAVLELVDHGQSELSLRLVGDDEMAALNAGFRGREGPTDVLSFSLLEGDHTAHRGSLLGDVVIDVPVARRQAAERQAPLPDELRRLLVHGVLHLLGHDHEDPGEAAVMEAEERRVLARLGDRTGAPREARTSGRQDPKPGPGARRP